MEGFVIKYNDIYNLLWEYKEKLERLIEKLEACENSIRFFIESESFQGESANAIKSYMNDVHITMISSFKVTAQNLLDNIVLYKAGYYEIDSSTNFVLPEEAIKEFRKKLGTSCTDTEDCAGEIYGTVSGISDISAVSQPDTNGVFKIHEQLDQELLQFISAIETQESNTVKALENSTDLLIGSLQACIGKIGTNWTDINHYESNSFYTDTDVYTLAGLSQIFYEQHQNYQEVYEQIWGQEQALKDAAEARETQGIWKTVGGVALVVTGGLCIAATGGAATPIVVAGWGIGGGTIAFGVADSVEGAQDIYYGSMGDIDSTSINQLKDVIFQGNEDAYYFAENIFAFAASAFIPISQASVAGNLTFRSGTTIVAKEGISTLAGEGVSNITMNLTDNQTASMLAGMMASGVTAQGLNGIDGKFNISGWNNGGKYSLLGDMSFEDGKQYSAWNKLREDGFSYEQAEKIKSIDKGKKPVPETYLSEDYIKEHLQSFKDNGAVKIMPNEPSGTIGARGGTFVMSGEELSEIIQYANGDLAKIESALGLDPGYLGNDPVIVTIKDTSTIRIPSGNELGAWPEYWEPGGYTSGGIKEAVIDPVSEGNYTFKHLFE